MRILYKNEENGSLTLTDVTSTRYVDDEGVLVFYGDDDVCIHVDQKTADGLTKQLFLEDRLDISGYDCSPYDFDEFDDDEDDDDDDDDILDGSPFVFKF